MRSFETGCGCIFCRIRARLESIIDAFAVTTVTIPTGMISRILLLRTLVSSVSLLCRSGWQTNSIRPIDHALPQQFNLILQKLPTLPLPLTFHFPLPIPCLPLHHHMGVLIHVVLQLLYASSQFFLLFSILFFHASHFFLQLSNFSCSSFPESPLRLPILCLSFRRWCVDGGFPARLRLRRQDPLLVDGYRWLVAHAWHRSQWLIDCGGSSRSEDLWKDGCIW